MQVDPEFLRKLDPRKSYLPTRLPPAGDETGGSRLRLQLPPPSHRTEVAMPDQVCTLGSLSTDDLREELRLRKSRASRLLGKRNRLIAEIAALDAEIARLLGTGAGSHDAPARNPTTSRRASRLVTSRSKNRMNLPDAIAAAVALGKVVSPAEAVELVKQGGYVSSSKTFGQAVATTLAKHRGFTRVGRGRYEKVAT